MLGKWKNRVEVKNRGVSFVKGLVYLVKNRGEVKNRERSFVNVVVRPVKNRGTILIYNLIKTFPLFFTGRKRHLPGIGIETIVWSVTCHVGVPHLSPSQRG